MFNVEEHDKKLKITCSSQLSAVNRVVLLISSFLEQYGIGEDRNFNLVVREMMNNGIEHGNKNDMGRNIVVDLEIISDHRVSLSVEDAGNGFDHASLSFRLPEADETERSKGLPLIHRFSDEITFNEAGNRISVFYTFTKKTAFDVSESTGKFTLRIRGNLTADMADSFRKILNEISAKEVKKVTFDLRDVSDIDSISFSIFAVFANLMKKKSPQAVLEIENASIEIMNLLLLTRMDKLYTIAL